MESPKRDAEQMQVRYADASQTKTVSRSHVGSTEEYAAYEKLIAYEKECRKKEIILQYKRAGTRGSGLNELKRKLSIGNNSSMGLDYSKILNKPF